MGIFSKQLQIEMQKNLLIEKKKQEQQGFFGRLYPFAVKSYEVTAEDTKKIM